MKQMVRFDFDGNSVLVDPEAKITVIAEAVDLNGNRVTGLLFTDGNEVFLTESLTTVMNKLNIEAR